MTQNDIAPQPRIAADGAPLCHESCPHFRESDSISFPYHCELKNEVVHLDDICRPALVAEREQWRAEIDRLRAALATPEVYAGVVQEQVAREREAAIARAAAAEAKLAQAKQACRRLIEQNLCWGHAEAARQVMEAMGEQP